MRVSNSWFKKPTEEQAIGNLTKEEQARRVASLRVRGFRKVTAPAAH